MTNRMIEVNDLKKSYGKVQAVKSLSFYVEQGKLFAFLGPNGAGKSTTIDIITTFLQKDSGTVTIDGLTLGKDDEKIRRIIGAVFQDNMLESGGQRRRADIARALVHTPKILFLDEPTTGLDPQTRKTVWETIRRLQQETGMTVFLTTHYMEEAAEADYVVVIDSGEIAARGTPSQLKETYAGDFLKLVPKKASAEKIRHWLTDKKLPFTENADTFRVSIPHTMDALPLVDECRHDLDSLEIVSGTMDDAFIAITGKEIRE